MAYNVPAVHDDFLPFTFERCCTWTYNGVKQFLIPIIFATIFSMNVLFHIKKRANLVIIGQINLLNTVSCLFAQTVHQLLRHRYTLFLLSGVFLQISLPDFVQKIAYKANKLNLLFSHQQGNCSLLFLLLWLFWGVPLLLRLFYGLAMIFFSFLLY
jgi:hypothetical protein